MRATSVPAYRHESAMCALKLIPMTDGTRKLGGLLENEDCDIDLNALGPVFSCMQEGSWWPHHNRETVLYIFEPGSSVVPLNIHRLSLIRKT